MRTKSKLYTIIFSCILPAYISQALDTSLIYERYKELKAAIQKQDTPKLLFNLKQKNLYSREDLKFISHIIVTKNPDPNLFVGLRDNKIIWTKNQKESVIDLSSQLGEGIVLIDGVPIQLQIDLHSDFKTFFKTNKKRVMKSLLKSSISKMTVSDFFIAVALFPLASLSACSTPESNDAELLSIAGWEQIQTPEEKSYLFAQDREGNKRAYLNAQTDSRALKDKQTTHYELQSKDPKSKETVLIRFGGETIVPKGKFSEDPNLINVFNQKVR